MLTINRKLRPLEHVRYLRLGELVSRRATKEPRFIYDYNGQVWVGKSEQKIKLKGLIAEAVGCLVAQVVKAPVADGGLTHIDGTRWWCSKFVPAADSWEDIRGNQVHNPQDCARLYALDALLMNPDRHLDNLMLYCDHKGYSKVIGIDHEEAYIGYYTSPAVKPGEVLNDEKFPDSFMSLPSLYEDLVEISIEIHRIDRSEWNDVASLTNACIPQVDISSLSECLYRRAQDLPSHLEILRRRRIHHVHG